MAEFIKKETEKFKKSRERLMRNPIVCLLVVLSILCTSVLGIKIYNAFAAQSGPVYIQLEDENGIPKGAPQVYPGYTNVRNFTQVPAPSHYLLTQLFPGYIDSSTEYTIQPKDNLSYIAQGADAYEANDTFTVTITGHNGSGTVLPTPTPIVGDGKVMICFATFYYIWSPSQNDYKLIWADINEYGGSAKVGQRLQWDKWFYYDGSEHSGSQTLGNGAVKLKAATWEYELKTSASARTALTTSNEYQYYTTFPYMYDSSYIKTQTSPSGTAQMLKYDMTVTSELVDMCQAVGDKFYIVRNAYTKDIVDEEVPNTPTPSITQPIITTGPSRYYVRYIGNGGKLDGKTSYMDSSEYYQIGDYVNIPWFDTTPPVENGYLLGWSNRSNGSVLYYPEDSFQYPSISGNTYQLYAIWEKPTPTPTPMPEIIYTSGGGTGSGAHQSGEGTKTIHDNDGNSGTSFLRRGYHFAGHWLNSDNGNTVLPGSRMTISGWDIITLSAQWLPNNYIVDFDYCPGFLYPGTAVTKGAYGESLIGGDSVEIYNDGYVSATTDTYKGLDSHTTTLLADQKVVTIESAIGALPSPKAYGYDFKGWSYNKLSSGNGSQANLVESTDSPLASQITGDYIHLYASWNPVNVKVHFNLNGVSKSSVTTTSLDDITVAYTSKYGYIPTTYRTGYEVCTWQDDTGKTITEDTVMLRAEDHTLYAQWIPKQFTVHFDPQGGTACSDKTVVYDGTYGTMPTTTKKGNDFKGWNTSPNGDGKWITSSTKVDILEDQTLYAIWDPKTYTVTFDYNWKWKRDAVDAAIDGTPVDINTHATSTQTVTYGSCYNTLPTPSREGYSFLYWKDSKGNIISTATEYTATKDTTLTAEWKPLTVLLYFDDNITSYYTYDDPTYSND